MLIIFYRGDGVEFKQNPILEGSKIGIRSLCHFWFGSFIFGGLNLE